MSSDPVSWLLGLEHFGIKLGLHNISAILRALGHPERAFRTVHVAGTNGKGSVTAMLDAVLLAAGHRSARYTSPHLIDVTERFVVDGRAIERRKLDDVVSGIRGVVGRLLDEGELLGPPTFFEVSTAAAFELFRRAGVEIAVCEVGLGGRLDATNVIEPTAAAITSIGLDHQQYLGETLVEIAGEKAGIVKPGGSVVVGPMDPEAREAIAGVAAAQGAEVIDARNGVAVEEVGATVAFGPSRIRLRTPARDYGEIELALAGEHQVDNAIVAIRVLETLDRRGVRIPIAAAVDGLRRVRWPGRLDWRPLPDGRGALLDAAHNPDGAAALARFLAQHHLERRPIVFSAMRDKDVGGMLRHLAPVAGALVLTRASPPRAADPVTMAAVARAVAPGTELVIEPSPQAALAAAWRISPMIVVTGSIFLIGDVMGQVGGS